MVTPGSARGWRWSRPAPRLLAHPLPVLEGAHGHEPGTRARPGPSPGRGEAGPFEDKSVPAQDRVSLTGPCRVYRARSQRYFLFCFVLQPKRAPEAPTGLGRCPRACLCSSLLSRPRPPGLAGDCASLLLQAAWGSRPGDSAALTPAWNARCLPLRLLGASRPGALPPPGSLPPQDLSCFPGATSVNVSLLQTLFYNCPFMLSCEMTPQVA